MKRIYYGWWVVAMTTIIYMLIVGASLATFGLYVVPVSAELKLSRVEANTGLILINLGLATLAPFVGRVLDRVPVRRVMVACILLYGVSLAALSVSQSLWLSALILFFGVPIAYEGAGTLTNTLLLARWFQVHRGRAMALASMGMLLGNMIMAPLLGWVIENHGWRFSLMASGIALVVLMMPIALVVRDRPGPGDAEPGKAGESSPAVAEAPPVQPPAKVGEILRSPQFWLLSLSAAIGFSISQTVAISLPPLAHESGLSTVQAGNLLAAMGAGGMAGLLLLSLVADRIDRVVLLTTLLIAIGLLNAALISAEGYWMFLAISLCMGACSGVVAPAFFALLADQFGPASFGTVRGLNIPILTGLGAVTVHFGGEVFDRTGSYDIMFGAFIGLAGIAAAMMLALRFAGRPTIRMASTAG